MALLKREDAAHYSGVRFPKVHYMHLMLCVAGPDNIRNYYPQRQAVWQVA